jgi:hypothetical protein
MTIAIVELGETTLSHNWERIEFTVDLPDLKQPIIMACKGGFYYDSNTNNWATRKDKRKFRLTGFDYSLDEGVIALSALKGNFFTKANRVGATDSVIRHLDKETLDQIPDELHTFAREHFAKELAPLFQKIIDTGLVVKVNA